MGMYRILSIDGGGIRGAFAASVLAKFEEQLPVALHNYFDLVVGTSTGAIIAAAVASGIKANVIRNFYVNNGQTVFQRRKAASFIPILSLLDRPLSKYGITSAQLFGTKYLADELRIALDVVFGEQRMRDMKTRLLIPAVDMSTGKPVVFKSSHRADFIRDHFILVSRAVLASAAAPTYFPHAQLGPGSAYVDGGLFAHNPSLIGYAEAVRLIQERREGIDPEYGHNDIFVLSIGCGKKDIQKIPPSHEAGIAWWTEGGKLLEAMFQAQATANDGTLLYLIGNRRTRIDFSLADATWTLDGTHAIHQLVNHGVEQASVNWLKVREFFSEPVAFPFVPFEPPPATIPGP